MFSKCQYCNDSNCWGHSNDEISALTLAKESRDNARNYWKKIERIESHVNKEINRLKKIQEDHELDLTDGGGLNEYGNGQLYAYKDIRNLIKKLLTQ